MRKIKLKLSYTQAQALLWLLQAWATQSVSEVSDDVERMWVSQVYTVAAKIYKDTLFPYTDDKNFKFSIGDGFGMKAALVNMASENGLKESTRMFCMMELERQLPIIGKS